MKSYIGALVCLGLAACSHDRPAETAYDSTQSNGVTTDPQLTPASSEGEPRAAGTSDPSHHSSTTPPSTAPATTDAPNVMQANPGPNNSAATTTPAPSKDAAHADHGVKPDNTKVNERDRDGSTKTPLDQGNNETDLKITQQIRQAVMGDKSLSFNAKNVKIITSGGKVTLRGPVKTEAEKSAIDAAARKVAGGAQVDNQIEVKP